jgi:hypothetical protein
MTNQDALHEMDAGPGPNRVQRSRRGNSSRGGSRRAAANKPVTLKEHSKQEKQERKQEKQERKQEKQERKQECKQERKQEKRDVAKEKKRRGSRVNGSRVSSQRKQVHSHESRKGKEPAQAEQMSVSLRRSSSASARTGGLDISDAPVTVRKFVLGGKLTHPNMLMQSNLADVEFTTVDGAVLHAHSYVLLVRCEPLADLVHSPARREKWRTHRPRRHNVERFVDVFSYGCVCVCV